MSSPEQNYFSLFAMRYPVLENRATYYKKNNNKRANLRKKENRKKNNNEITVKSRSRRKKYVSLENCENEMQSVQINPMLPSDSLMDEFEELNEIPLEIVEIEKRTQKTNQKFIEICKQLRKFENGDSPKIHIDQAMKDLEKRSKTCSEAWMKVLTDLDSIQLDESQTLARSKRKSIVNSTNANMDGADEILRRIKNLKEKAFVN